MDRRELRVEYSFTEWRDVTAYPRATDNTKRISFVGECSVKWRDGFRRMIAERHPDLAAGAPA